MRKLAKILIVVAVLAGTLIPALKEYSSLPVANFFAGPFAHALTPNLTYIPFMSKGYTSNNTVPPLGVQMDNLSDTSALALAQQMGARWARVGIWWSTLEPSNMTQNNFNWSEYDAKFIAASQYSITPVVTISGNPSWAADTVCGPIRSVYLQDFASFLQAVAGRYSQAPYNVHYWEFYNEPDNTDAAGHSWLGGCWGSNGTDYANMLKVAYPAIKAADPQAQVVLGSVAYDSFTTDGGIFNKDFLEDVLSPAKGGAGAYFDILGFHFYPAFRENWEPFGTDVLGKVNYIKGRMNAWGVNKPMAVTEINMWSASKYGGSDALQSDYVVQSMVRSWAAGLKFAIWFALTDWNDWGYGLLRTDLSQKPAYATYSALSSALQECTYTGLLQIDGVQPPGVEGYTFMTSGGQERYVAWATGSGSAILSFNGSRAVITDRAGVKSTATGAGGRVAVSVTSSPVFVEVTP